MLTIIYAPDEFSYAIADGHVVSSVNSMIESYKEYPERNNRYVVCNELVIEAFRVAIKQKKISHDEIQFEFNEEILSPDSNSRLKHWPSGFCDLHSSLIDELIKG